MPTPRPPIEDTRPGRFRPTHCPRRDCPAHTLTSGFRWRFRGSYRVKHSPNRRIPIIECLHCRRTSSRNAYSCTYYLKRPQLLPAVADGLVAGSAHRQIARSLRCAPSTVTRLAARLGRHAMLYQARALARHGPPDEPVVFDHFISFVYSQRERLAIGSPIGVDSWFDYGPDVTTYRGATKRAAHKRPVQAPETKHEPAGLERSLRATLDRLTHDSRELELITDEHPAYRRAVATARDSKRIRHTSHRNPPRSTRDERRRARTRDRALFAVDMVHKLTRHSMAHHRRETIAFARRSNAAAERAMIFTVWRNFIKRRSEREPDHRSPAMMLKLATERLTWDDVLERRLFPGRIPLSERWTAIYRRELTTPAVGRNLRHELIHAY